MCFDLGRSFLNPHFSSAVGKLTDFVKTNYALNVNNYRGQKLSLERVSKKVAEKW